MKLTDFKALTFDCYGTLIDWESGMFEALQPLTRRVGRALSRDEILGAHARHESAQQAQTPAKAYRDLLPIVYKRLAEEWGVAASWDECVAYGRSVRDWPAFPDSAAALQYLKKHYKLVILSNVDNESFAGSNKKLQVEFDAIYTAEDVGAYKPSDRNFEYLLANIRTLGSRSARSCTPRKACSTTTVPRTGTGSRRAGFIGAPARRVLARRCIPAKCRRSISGSTAWPTWSRRIRRS